MAVSWSDTQRPRVARVLRECPVESGRCEGAARRILPVARETDDQVQIWQLWPTEGVFVLAKHPDARRWRFHATVEAQAHCVDALTGVDGTAIASYLHEHWHVVDALRWVAGDRDEVRP